MERLLPYRQHPRRDDSDAATAYLRYDGQVARLSQLGRSVDLSRRDALAAAEMRAAGYSRAAIENAVRDGACRMRPEERRDWRLTPGGRCIRMEFRKR